jgi:urease accessory protein
MLVADTVLGNRADPEVADRLDEADPLRIDVTETERRRSRFRTKATDGTELGVVVGRELEDGDVLSADGRLVLVRLELIEAVALDFTGATVSPTEAMAVGHAVGNRHWTLAVEHDTVLIPTGAERERIESAVGPLLERGVDLHVVDVSPATFDEAGTPDHDHAHGDGHSHQHSHETDIGGDPGR